MAELPIACRLTDRELQARREGLLARARRFVVASAWKDERLVLELAATPQAFETAAELVTVERQCCPFLHFQLSAGPDGAPVALEIGGPPGTRAFLTTLGFESHG